MTHIAELLEKSPDDQEVAMVAAVVLGSIVRREEDLATAEMLIGLLASKFERVRYRAVRSIHRRASRFSISTGAINEMIKGVDVALNAEDSDIVLEPLESARKKLRFAKEIRS